ncbi:transcriptional regulator [Geobacillus subterraneus]|uniref:Transcriptional regulator n=2 Tax=Geobacillus TaxID=129337 RepID=A0ABM6A957_9BACL|nr:MULTISPECIES: post-transcriptional regulator [Geobacillus]AMX82777.1 transcriptional regulator [Geobacillus subterraneus]KZS26141.1 transcriptional regulator [Geobacillus subterraneus]OXB90871.1 transcriptional regulator [Geobacillus uzenensis]QIZ68492.1 transcriptional regulator [Geobacillus subterraneus]WPZ17517.1 post-transcriptional regulator [Geobacillus subterraneus]
MERERQLRKQLMPALECKYDEFRLLGYTQVTIDGLWEYLCARKWKNALAEKKLYELVSDILSLSPGEYMAFLTRRSYERQRAAGDDDLERVLNELL